MNSTYAARAARNQWPMVMALVVAFIAAWLSPAVEAQSARAAPAAQAKVANTVLVMGDSLSAAYGLSAAQGWVALTGARMAKTNPGWRVVNASISGETTAGGVARLPAELRRVRPKVVVMALGANDGLRGLPLAQTKANLDRMIRASKQSGAKVLLVGMQIPPNYGREYTRGFQQNFSDLAKAHSVAFVPFLLAPIATDRAMFQDDHLHPVAGAQPKIRDHVWGTLSPLLK